jgi:hypothetical protein
MARTYDMDGGETSSIVERKELAKAENQMIPPELRPAFNEKEKNRKYLENMKRLRDRGKLG